MNICVFDTETTSLEKPFCYNIGYVILNDKWEILLQRSFVVQQIWHNLPLFSTAYYAEKRPIYVKEMRAKKTRMDKFGFICQQMIRDFQQFNVAAAFAYNSPFDEKVFNFNCDWFKVINPFDTIPIYDIRGYVHNSLMKNDFFMFCEYNQLFTETGNYSTTAETLYKYISRDTEFIEAHTAIEDSLIEYQILKYCCENGAVLGEDYKAKKSIERKTKKELSIVKNYMTIFKVEYEKIRIKKGKEGTEIKID